MTETEVEIIEEKKVDNKIPVLTLNDLVMKQAEEIHAPQIAPAREKTGSTDFGNVMRRVPGTCARIAFVAPGAAAHSQEYIAGKRRKAAHDAVIYGAKILAGTALEPIENRKLFKTERKEFRKIWQREFRSLKANKIPSDTPAEQKLPEPKNRGLLWKKRNLKCRIRMLLSLCF